MKSILVNKITNIISSITSDAYIHNGRECKISLRVSEKKDVILFSFTFLDPFLLSDSIYIL